MPDNIKEIKDFVRVEVEGLRRELTFYCKAQIPLSQISKGILFGKNLAYGKVLDFISEMEKELNK